MNVITKAVAAIEAVPDSEATDPNGEFDLILSAQSRDRDGDTFKQHEWKTPLPDHITFDIDHGRSVATTVGSGKPFFNENGDIQVRGTFSSIPRAQEVRTLVREGHIRTASVAYLTDRSETKDGVPMRELLNGAFVAIPSNRDTKVLAAKALQAVEEKSGARNNAQDRSTIQDIHDAAKVLGADCGTGAADGANKSLGTKAATDTDDSPAALASACDAALDEALALVADVDPESLPAEVAQALALLQAADNSIDALLDLLGIPDPDEDSPDEDGAPADSDAEAPAPAEKSAAAAAEVADDAADVVLRGRALQLIAESAALLG